MKQKFPIHFSGITAFYRIEREGKKYRVWYLNYSEDFLTNCSWLKGILLNSFAEVMELKSTIEAGTRYMS